MERKRRTDKYQALASLDSAPVNPPVSGAPSKSPSVKAPVPENASSEKKRNSCSNQPQGYRPPTPQTPERKKASAYNTTSQALPKQNDTPKIPAPLAPAALIPTPQISGLKTTAKNKASAQKIAPLKSTLQNQATGKLSPIKHSVKKRLATTETPQIPSPQIQTPQLPTPLIPASPLFTPQISVPEDPTQPASAPRKPKVSHRTLYIATMAVLLCVFAFAAYKVIDYFVQSRQAQQEEQMVKALIAQNDIAAVPTVSAEPTASLSGGAVPPSSPAPDLTGVPNNPRQEHPKPEVLIQFVNALALNPDTVGMLQMGESINTYVVQRDNSYYLRRSFTGEYSFSGAIFLDVTCSIYPQSRNLILHGHNMRDGTAFGKLSRFEKADYLNKYPFVGFSTLYESARYSPFAVVYYSIDPKAEDYLDIYSVNAMTDQEFIQFVSKIRLMSVYHIPVNVAKTDKILTVTTCATGDPDVRLAVFAVKSKLN